VERLKPVGSEIQLYGYKRKSQPGTGGFWGIFFVDPR